MKGPALCQIIREKAMNRDEIEALITAKIETGDAGTGLYDTGLQYVVVDYADIGKGNGLTFKWFDTLRTVDDLIHA
jgi:hypothetical protein